MMVLGALLILNTLINGFIFYFLNLVPLLLVISGAVYEFTKRRQTTRRGYVGGEGLILQPIIVSRQMICQNCGAENPLRSKVCQGCGAKLYEDMPGRRCPVCLAPLKLASILGPGHVMCNVCYSEFQLASGSKISQLQTKEPHYSDKRVIGMKTKIAIGGVVLFILFLIIAGFSASIQRQPLQNTSVMHTLTTQQHSPTTVIMTKTPTRGSITNPAVVGEPVTVVRLGNTFEITVLDYIRGEQANSEIKSANLFNPSPEVGYEYVLVKVRVKYVKGDDTAPIGILNFKAFVNGTGHNPTFAVHPIDKPDLKSVTLIPGGIAEGWVLFEVPQGGEILISFAYLFSDPLCFIKLERT